MINPVNVFIETDDLEQFVAAGGTRTIAYSATDSGFRFEYRKDEHYLAYLLPDEINDPSERERLILEMERVAVGQLG